MSRYSEANLGAEGGGAHGAGRDQAHEDAGASPSRSRRRFPRISSVVHFALWPWVIVTIAFLLGPVGVPSSAGGAQEIAGSGSTTFTAVEDTYVKSSRPHRVHGHRKYVGADMYPSVKWGLLRFDVHGIPENATITSATLNLFVTNRSNVPGAVYTIAGDWSEKTTNWTNAPLPGGVVTIIRGRAAQNTWKEANVTPAVTDNGDVDFYIITPSADGVDYASKEHPWAKPTLTVVWKNSAPSPTPEPKSEGTPEPRATPKPPPPAPPTPEPTATPTPEPTSVPMPDPTSVPTPTASPTPEPTPTAPPPSPSGGGSEGRIGFLKKADSAFDRYADNPSQWAHTINSRYAGLLMYPPHSDAYSWYTGEGFFYLDAYAIYVSSGSNPAGAGMQHVLRDGAGNPCYIPWGSPFPQYAADVGNPQFRSLMTSYIVSKLNSFPHYDGVYLDDVNLDLSRVSCGNQWGSGNNSSPLDQRTGQVMTNQNWRRYFVEFLEQVKNAIPNKKVVHNTVWYLVPFGDPYLARQIRAAHYVEMEQGFIDRGLTGGTGTFSWVRKMDFVDMIHNHGTALLDQDLDIRDTSEQKYGLANYLLFANGKDLYSTFYGANPDQSWNVYGADLGAAQGARYQWNGLWRRDFKHGFVLVNPPGASARTVSLGGGYSDLWGGTYGSITLHARQGTVFMTN